MNPIRNTVYTVRQILTEVKLQDMPHFMFWRRSPFQMLNDGKDTERLALMTELGFDEDVDCVLQHGHVTEEQLLSVPGFAGSRWRYIRTTDEWIPLFRLENHSRDDVAQWFDLEQYIGDYGQLENGWSVTPKGFPREQYYADPGSRWQVVLEGHRVFPDAHRKLHHLTPFKVVGMDWPDGVNCPRVVKPIPGTNAAGLFPHQQKVMDALDSGKLKPEMVIWSRV
jgi:hypothetical protein